MEAITKRYSIRDYEERPVPEEKLRKVLEAARLAPSASNRQQWKFIVVRESKRRQELARAAGGQVSLPNIHEDHPIHSRIQLLRCFCLFKSVPLVKLNGQKGLTSMKTEKDFSANTSKLVETKDTLSVILRMTFVLKRI